MATDVGACSFYTLALVRATPPPLPLHPQGHPNVRPRPSLPRLPSRVSCRSDITEAKSQSTTQFVTALVFNAAAFAIQVVAFTIVRPYFRAIYEPRSYIPIEAFVSFAFIPAYRNLTTEPEQETRPTSVTKCLRLAPRIMEG